MKDETRSVRLNVRITPTLHKRLIAKAKRCKWSLSATIEEGIFEITAV